MQALAKTPPEKTRGARLRSSQKRTRAEAIAAELFRRLQADAYRDGRLPSQRQLAESFGVSRGTVARALEYLERNGWIATSARRRPVLTPPERVFSGKLNGFLDASHFRPPLVNAAFDRKDRRNGESTSVIDLSVLCHEHWDEHINFDIESEAVERALGRFARGETDIYRTTGIPALKAAICRYLAPYGIVAKPSEIAVISLGGIVSNNSIRIAGDDLTADIQEYMSRQHNVKVSERMAERIKIHVGAALTELGEDAPEDYIVHGPNRITALPMEVPVCYQEIAHCLEKSISKIETAVLSALENTPPELYADIVHNGIYLAGGGALLRGLDKRLTDKINIPFHIAEDPLHAVAKGTGIALKNVDKFSFLMR